MATSTKTLGQVATPATTLTTLYTVPASTSTVVSTISVCNRGSSSTTFRIAVRTNGDAINDKHYLYYDVSISANDSFASTIGVCLSATDVVSVYAGNSNLTFQIFGEETS